MKGFEDYRRRATRTGGDPDWSEHYVDYGMLKEELVAYSKRRQTLRKLIRGRTHLSEEDLRLVFGRDAEDGGGLERPLGGSGRGGIVVASADAADGDYFNYVSAEEIDKSSIQVDPDEALLRLSRIERGDFCGLLDKELEKAATFYGTQIVYLAKSIDELGGKPADSSSEYESGVRVGDEILELLAFVAVNVITLRQILIRYDALARTFGGLSLSQWYLQERAGDAASGDYIEDIFHLAALDSLEESFVGKMRALQQSGGMQIEGAESTLAPAAAPRSYLLDFSRQMDQFRILMDKTFQSVERAAKGHIVLRDHFVATARTLNYYFLLGSGLYSLSLEPKVLLMRGRHLKEEMRTVAKWKETKDIAVEGEEAAARKLDPENVFPLILNLLTCFLQMMNNYIIEPSSAYYANALGTNDAMSGLMLAMSPWFALISAIGYSFWTNHSYRQPMIFACVLSVVGNLLYGSALGYSSMTVCLVGRALTGLGATRIINRRYVADSTPFALRTAASAAFALATALGAALGPAMAIVLDCFDFEFYLPFMGKQQFNGMTGPGFFMALCWLLMTFVMIIFFKEPSRSGLDELKKREEVAEDTGRSPSGVGSKTGDSQSVGMNSDVSFASHGDAFDDDTNYDVGLSDDTLDEEHIAKQEENLSSVFYCLKRITRPVILTMALIFMKRITLESIVGSTSVITKNRYGWSIKDVGTLHFVNGMIVIPISILSGWLSRFYQDRYLAMWLLSITLFGMMFLIDVTDFVSTETATYNEGHWLAVGPVKYITGSLIAFSAIEACESFVASLMSKVVPSALAAGTFNSGLLVTLVGTSGRATGDILITVMGSISIRNLLNLLVLPGAFLVIVSISLIRWNYEMLAV